jgi:adenylate cyclase
MKRRFSIPFGITLLGLMGLIVAPLTGVLFWLGDKTVDTLEHRSVQHRILALNATVDNFLSTGLLVIVSVGSTLAEEPSFRPSGLEGVDEARLRQLVALLERHQLVAAAYVGYADSHFIYAGHTASLSGDQRVDYHAPPEDAIILRTIEGEGAARRETWRFRFADGRLSRARSRPTDYDPRQRPWYVDALRTRQPALTDPYVFASADVVGVSAGVPMPDGAGALGFDVTLETLSTVVASYKITPNSIIMIGSPTGGAFVQSPACQPLAADCLPGGGAARLALGGAIRESGGTRRIERHTGTGDDAYELIVEPMRRMLGQQIVVAAAVPVVEAEADSRTLLRNSLAAAIVAFGLAALAALAGSVLLSRPLLRIAAKTERIRNLDFSDRHAVQSRIREIARLSDAVERMRDGLEVFGRYVSRRLVDRIMHSPEGVGLHGERREITVMFTDIEGFSRIAETLPPEVLTRRLSHYFEALGGAISTNDGTIDKYIGDSIMAYWNAPETDEDHVLHACRAALQVAAASRHLADKWRTRGRPAFRTRIGVHTGPAVVGNVGTKERINYTLVGTVANQASRLEGLNKAYGTTILVSGRTVDAVADRFVWRFVDRVVAAGTTEVHDIYEPLGEKGEEARNAAFLARWQEGHAAYARAEFPAALAGFRAAADLRPDDGPCRVFIRRCETFLQDGPPGDWDAAWRFDRK